MKSTADLHAVIYATLTLVVKGEKDLSCRVTGIEEDPSQRRDLMRSSGD